MLPLFQNKCNFFIFPPFQNMAFKRRRIDASQETTILKYFRVCRDPLTSSDISTHALSTLSQSIVTNNSPTMTSTSKCQTTISTEDDHIRDDNSILSISDDSGILQSQLDKCELKDSGVRLDVKPKNTITLTLDVLVADKIQQDELDRMNKELQADLECGGVSNMLAELSEPCDGMLPEHKKTLEKLSNFPQHNINELPPWETLFEASNYCCLFNSDLQLNHIQFMPGNSKIDNTLANTEGTEQLEFILKSDILRIVWYAVSNKNLVLRWLFFLMSIHKDVSVSEACYQIIMNAIQLQLSSSRTKNTWAPDIADILRIFINYGAPVHDLVPNQTFLQSLPLGALQTPINTNCKQTKQDKSSTSTTSGNIDPAQPVALQDAASAPKLRKSDETQFNTTGLVYVLSVLSFVLDSRPNYTTDQLSALFLMLCKIRLDIHIATDPLVKNLQSVLSRIIQKYPNTEWPETAINLSIDLATLTRDPHNMLFLTQTLPHCQHSVELRQRLATLQLYLITEQDISTISKQEVNISQLFCLFPHLKSFAQNKLSTLSITVDLLSIAVGGISFQKSDRENLQQIMLDVMQLSECLRDNGRTVACSVVKNKLVILSNRWKIFLETVGLTQKKLFAWTRVDGPQEFIKKESEGMAIHEEIILSDSDSSIGTDSGSFSDCSIFSLPDIGLDTTS